jgi:hypothetical protein
MRLPETPQVPVLCWRRTILLVNLLLDVEVDTRDDHVGDDIKGADTGQDSRVIEGDFLGYLHKTPTRQLGDDRWALGDIYSIQDEDEVGTAQTFSKRAIARGQA